MTAPDARILAAQVAAWHNRHPLARRIAADQVRGIGVVALPFLCAPTGSSGISVAALDPGAPPGVPAASLRERALAQAHGSAEVEPRLAPAADRSSAPQPSPRRAAERAFDEDFIAPIAPRRAAAFAARHGVQRDPSGGAWPCRKVQVAVDRLGMPVQPLFVRTAAIELEDRRVRLLVSASDGGFAIAGPRLFSMPRVGSLFGALCSAFAITLAIAHREAAPVVPVAGPSPAAVAVSVAPPVADPAPQAALPQSPPAPPPPVREEGSPPADIRPVLAPRLARQARQESEAVREAALRASEPAPETSRDDSGKTFALVARTTRSRAASQVLLGLMQATAARDARAESRTDVLAAGEGFRASWWPFTSRQDAERAREQLAAVGLPVDLVEF